MTSMLSNLGSCPSDGAWKVAESSLSGGAHESYAAERLEGLPVSLLQRYAQAAARHYESAELGPDHWFASVRGIDGAWGEGESLEVAIADLELAILNWVVLKRRVGADDIPVVDGLNLNRTADGRTP